MVKTVTVVNGSITGTFGWAMSIYQLFAPVYIFGGIYTIFKKYKRVSFLEKIKIKYALIGISLFVGPAVITNAVLPLWFNVYSLNSVGPLFSILMVSFISYAIVRHQFLDIKIIIQKGLIYSVLLSVIISTYIFLVFTFEYLFAKSSEVSILISALITTLVGIFGVLPLEKYFQKATDRFFFKDTYDYAEVLGSLTDVLNTNIALDTIVEKTTQTLEHSLKPETVAFSFNERGKPEREDTIVLPIKSNKKNIGYLVLGEKRSGDQYTKEDMSLLTTFATQAGTALEKASLYKQVKEYANTLEMKVEERTKEIVAIQKEQETLMLEISHGLQTPLTIMKGELFFLRKQGYDTVRVDTIDASIDRISAFIYRFLSLSRLGTAAVSEKVNLNLSMLLQNIVSFFEQETNGKSIQLTSNIADDIFVKGTKEEIEELFSNLISNSIKYMSKEGSRRIALILKEDENNAVITLQDTGIGIRAENLQNLFKKFYRVKEDETKGIQGTGLGLVICKKIVDMNGGSIGVTSTFGEGTTFTITFPKCRM
ncbi:MAG: GAF domain-containing sensor histidine kinase [Minisyncoccia bacterium]